MHNILVTGALGFIGFNAIQFWKTTRPQYNYVALDLNTYAAEFMLDRKMEWLISRGDIPLYSHTDIKSRKDVESIIKKNNIDTIVNFAAESHVDLSIKNPRQFVESNVLGVVNLLEMCNKYNIRLHQVSTDEVIGSVSPENIYSPGRRKKRLADETAVLNPSSPYSSSKASAELMCISFHKTFGTNVTISRCTNNFGPWQHTEKLIPMVISNAMNNKKIPVYGDGRQRRFWIHVDEHNKAIMDILENGRSGEIYNISPKFKYSDYGKYSGNLKYNITVIKKILKYMGKPLDLIEYVKDRPAHDNCYFLIGDKIKSECGYEDRSGFDSCLRSTVDWYMEHLG